MEIWKILIIPKNIYGGECSELKKRYITMSFYIIIG